MITILIWIGISAGVSAGIFLLKEYITSIKENRARYLNMIEEDSRAYTLKRYDMPGYYPIKQYIPFKDLPSLPVEQFIRFYSVDPSKWRMEQGCAYRTDDPSAAIFFQPYSNFKAYEEFRIATKKEYELMEKEKAERLQAIKKNEDLEAILQLVQKDIDATYEKAHKELQKATELTNRVMNNIKEK